MKIRTHSSPNGLRAFALWMLFAGLLAGVAACIFTGLGHGVAAILAFIVAVFLAAGAVG